MERLIYFIEFFVFVLSCLNITKNVFKFIKVFKTQQGSINEGKYDSLFFALSFAYVITILILGF